MLCVLKDEQRTWSFESETGAGVIRAARRSTRRDMAIRNRLVCVLCTIEAPAPFAWSSLGNDLMFEVGDMAVLSAEVLVGLVSLGLDVETDLKQSK